ncbi:MAG: primosomal protein N' [Phycisphaeraceae bacterium]|nr:primosomal protein N' [Phycisphaeraceae bacterium]
MMSDLFSKPVELCGWAQVAPEQGVDLTSEGLTYGIPLALAGLQVGERVAVPLGRGNRPVAGYVTALLDHCDLPAEKLKTILHRDPQSIRLPEDLMSLARWMAGYYCCPLGMVLTTMLPAAVKRGTGLAERTVVGLSDVAEAGKVTALQQSILDAAKKLRDDGEAWVEPRRLADLAGAKTVTAVKQLVQRGWLQVGQDHIIRAGWDLTGQPAPTPAMELDLHADQAKAIASLTHDAMIAAFGVHLLHGVTGSGKTEVYLRVIAHLLRHLGEASGGVIVMVPEIALTPQTVSRFTGRFPDVAVLHSALTASQRHDQWRRIAAGKASIVIGARSAVFAPMPKLSLIVVDEEHDNSYKQDQLPRYHGRDVAIKRAQIANVPVILGSATPSLESYANATIPRGPDADGPSARPRYHLHTLPQRVAGFKLPNVQIIDLIQERRARRGVHLLSRQLEDVLGHTLRTGGQALLLLNRRGYANYIACPDHNCGWVMPCDHCDTTVVYHKDAQLPVGGYVKCHHCEAEQMLPDKCPLCGRKITLFGLGTQRVEEELGRKFPKARLLRMDRDSMEKREHVRALEQFRAHEIDILVGTQMIAKGLDFPNVRFVGVICGDTSLNMPDFRAGERTFQLIAQVAGRTGRGDKPGLVIVQTFAPQDPAILLASKHDYEGFARRELALRKSMGLPPFARMARVVVRDQDAMKGFEQATTLAGHLRRFNAELGGSVRVRGPAPCAIARIANFHRQQIELIAPDAGTLQKLLTALRNARLLISDARTAVDVDPVDLL